MLPELTIAVKSAAEPAAPRRGVSVFRRRQHRRDRAAGTGWHLGADSIRSCGNSGFRRPSKPPRSATARRCRRPPQSRLTRANGFSRDERPRPCTGPCHAESFTVGCHEWWDRMPPVVPRPHSRIRVDALQLDDLVGLAGELAVVSDNLMAARLTRNRYVDGHPEALQRVSRLIRDTTLELRMVPSMSFSPDSQGWSATWPIGPARKSSYGSSVRDTIGPTIVERSERPDDPLDPQCASTMRLRVRTNGWKREAPRGPDHALGGPRR